MLDSSFLYIPPALTVWYFQKFYFEKPRQTEKIKRKKCQQYANLQVFLWWCFWYLPSCESQRELWWHIPFGSRSRFLAIRKPWLMFWPSLGSSPRKWEVRGLALSFLGFSIVVWLHFGSFKNNFRLTRRKSHIFCSWNSLRITWIAMRIKSLAKTIEKKK